MHRAAGWARDLCGRCERGLVLSEQNGFPTAKAMLQMRVNLEVGKVVCAQCFCWECLESRR